VDNFTSAKELVSQEEFESLEDMEKKGKILGAKVLLDYSYALSYAYDSSSAPYIAIFEDDMIFSDGWLSRSIMALQKIEEKTKSSGKDWLDLRLFNNESNIGFASSSIFGNNVPIIILLTSSAVFGILRLLYFKTTVGRRVITSKLCLVICCITIPLFVISFFQAGKSSVLPPSPGVAVQQWGLCTQGVILPRHQVPHLITELRKREHTQPDIVFKEYALSKGLQRFVLNPVQVQHLGKLTPEGSTCLVGSAN
jgi:GR25 family glycosyltransferase involved in LPS biosynthesis